METSVSQVAKYERCPSFFAYGHVYGDWPPSNAATMEGDELHMHHQLYFQKGLKYDVSTPMGKLASLALPLLPHPDLDDPVSEQVVNISYGPHTYRKNKIDLHYLAPLGPIVVDYKKSKDEGTMRRWGLNKQTLRADLQGNVYGYWAMKHYGYDYVQLRWLYHLVKEMRVEPIEVMIDMDDAKKVLSSHNVSINNMEYLHKARLPMAEIPKNLDACEDYEGCYYASKCGVTLRVRKPKSV